MKKNLLAVILLTVLPLMASAQTDALTTDMAKATVKETVSDETAQAEKKSERRSLLKEIPFSVLNKQPDTLPPTEFKKTFQVGSIIHMFGSLSQGPTTAQQDADPAFDNSWKRSFNLYRARILFGAQLSRQGSIFFETEIPSIIGSGPDGNKNIKVSPIILDAQYEHVFSNHFSVIAGQQLVSHNRNGLQGAAALMANDFTHYQYPYNLFESDPLQGNFGRDLGVNTRGFFLKDKLEYRLGAYTGRKFGGEGPIRMVGRAVYNFLNPEKDFYYAGTKLGAGKTFALGAGFDVQGTYKNFGLDAFLDVPAGSLGSVTVNAAFTTMTGGTETGKYSFATLIPNQTIQFLELGYYIPKLKLQPWFKYENQVVKGEGVQFGLPEGTSNNVIDDVNILKSNTRIGGGLNYFFNAYNANLRASYTNVIYGRPDINGKAERANYGQFWLQLQVFIF